MIPARIHFIWLGGPISPEASANIIEWRLAQRGWEINVHRDASEVLPEHQAAYDASRTLGDQTDVLRYSLLKQRPGWYLDCDTVPSGANVLDAIAERYPIAGQILAASDGKYPNPWCLATTPQCDAWSQIEYWLDDGAAQERMPFGGYGPCLLRGIEHLRPDLLCRAEVKLLIDHKAWGLSRLDPIQTGADE